VAWSELRGILELYGEKKFFFIVLYRLWTSSILELSEVWHFDYCLMRMGARGSREKEKFYLVLAFFRHIRYCCLVPIELELRPYRDIGQAD
jgi:hypothetical protein